MVSPVKIWRNQKNIRELLGKTGTILSWTIVRVPPVGFASHAPYAIALIALEDGKRIECQLVDCGFVEVATGKRVKTVIRRIMEPNSEGVIPYGIKAKLV